MKSKERKKDTAQSPTKTKASWEPPKKYMANNNTTWYASWFDTPFYHMLYKDRDYAEAKTFMNNLTSYLNLAEGSSILDLACGRGRHSIYLNSLGYDVTGLDLSANSIAHAKQFENDTLHFKVHNMCKPYGKHFDAVFNLFTSFGYFEKEESNLATIKAIKANLNDQGLAVMDFMNVDYVMAHLVKENTKVVDGIAFNQKRYLDNGYIVKDIAFDFEGEHYTFQERVRAFTLDDFKIMFEQAGVYLLDVFGNYKLHKFDAKESPRLIMVFK